MRGAVVVMLAGLGLFLSADSALSAALSQGQKNAINHIAQAQASADMCPRLEIDMLTFAIITTGFKLDFYDPAIQSYFKERYKAQILPWNSVDLDTDPNPACLAGLLLYGPTGGNVKGLLRLK